MITDDWIIILRYSKYGLTCLNYSNEPSLVLASEKFRVAIARRKSGVEAFASLKPRSGKWRSVKPNRKSYENSWWVDLKGMVLHETTHFAVQMCPNVGFYCNFSVKPMIGTLIFHIKKRAMNSCLAHFCCESIQFRAVDMIFRDINSWFGNSVILQSLMFAWIWANIPRPVKVIS